MPEKDFFTVEEAADYIGVHPDTIRHYIRVKKLRAIRIGTVYRIKKQDFDKFLEERYTTGDESSGEQ